MSDVEASLPQDGKIERIFEIEKRIRAYVLKVQSINGVSAFVILPPADPNLTEKFLKVKLQDLLSSLDASRVTLDPKYFSRNYSQGNIHVSFDFRDLSGLGKLYEAIGTFENYYRVIPNNSFAVINAYEFVTGDQADGITLSPTVAPLPELA